ncbi:MAG: proton-conducting transporter membrane subunit [Kiritimatiellia bacterium]
MASSIYIYYALAVPVVLALAALLRMSPAAQLRYLVLGTAVVALSALPAVIMTWVHGELVGAQGWLRLDALSALHVLLLLLVFVPAAVYAGRYFQEEVAAGVFTRKMARRFTGLWFGTLAMMLLVLFANNLGVMWFGVEATTLLTAFLICTHLSPGSLEAMWKYLLMCSVGIAVAFMGILLIAAATRQTGMPVSTALLWTNLMASMAQLDPSLVKAGFLFLVVGFGTKAGLAPMHNWLPDAHSQAPSPVSAVFSGCLLNSALYCILRCLPLAEGVSGDVGWARDVLVALGLISMVVAAGFLMAQRDLKRLLAYSSVEHIGIMALGAGLGGLGAFAALLHMLGHALAKPLGFFCAGSLGQAYGTHDMRRMGGVVRQVPVWGTGMILSLLALIGVAPGVLFLSELLVLKSAVEQHAWWTVGIYLAALAVAFIAVLRRALAIGWDASLPPPENPAAVAGGWSARLLVALPLVLLVVLGLCLPLGLSDLLQQAAAIIGGQP